MPRSAPHIVHFPTASAIVVTDTEHHPFVSVIGLRYGQEVEAILNRIPVVPGGEVSVRPCPLAENS